MQQRNRELADQINREALANPQSPYAGKYVGIWNGQVVVAAETLDEVCRRLDAVTSNPLDTFIVEASRDYSQAEWV
jgi:hypothetical protein